MITNPSAKDEVYLSNVEKIGNSSNNIRCIEDVLSPEDHAILLDYVKSQKLWVLEPWDSYSIGGTKLPENIYAMLVRIFQLVWNEATKQYGVGINNFNKENLALLKFEKGLFLRPHIDTESAESNHIASIYYINDDYIGGEICFPDFNINIKPKPNSLLYFPGNENYLHEVRKIIDGDRFTSSMWFQFTGSTFTKKAEWYN